MPWGWLVLLILIGYPVVIITVASVCAIFVTAGQAIIEKRNED